MPRSLARTKKMVSHFYKALLKDGGDLLQESLGAPGENDA